MRLKEAGSGAGAHRRPLSVSLALLLGLLALLAQQPPCVRADFALLTYPVLEGTDGVDPSQTLFPASALASSNQFCPEDSSGGRLPCVSVPHTRSCLSASAIESALSAQPAVLSSLHPRFGVRITMQTLDAPISNTLLEIERILLNEVMGYATSVRQDNTFAGELASCSRKEFDVHNLVFRSNYPGSQWNNALNSASGSGCVNAGTSGIIGANTWMTDTRSVEAAIAADEASGDYYRTWASQRGVEGLPRLNFTDVAGTYTPVSFNGETFSWEVVAPGAQGTTFWRASNLDILFIPPLCQNSSILCGIAVGYDFFYSRGWPEQQVVNLRWRVAVLFPSTTILGGASHDRYLEFVRERLDSGQQVLTMSTTTIPDQYANSDRMMRVLLPGATAACLADTAGPHADSGIGSVNCDFNQESTYKLSFDSGDTDKVDALYLHKTMLIDNAFFSANIREYYAGRTVAQVACDWVNNNTEVWSTWLTVQTPLKSTKELSEAGRDSITAICALFLGMLVVCHVFLALYRTHPVVKRSSPLFGQLVVLGCECFVVALLLRLPSQTEASCIAEQFLLSVGFSLFVGSLVVKTWRIDRIFNSGRLSKVSLPDTELLKVLAVYSSLDLLIVVLWAGISPPSPELEAHSSEGFTFVQVCSSSQDSPFRIATYLLRALALLAGAAFAVRLRDVSDAFNESKFLAVTVYNVSLLSAVVLGVLLIGSNDPVVSMTLYVAGLTLAVMVSAAIFVGSKMILVWKGGDTKTHSFNNHKSFGTGQGGHTADGDHAVLEMQQPSGVGGADDTMQHQGNTTLGSNATKYRQPRLGTQSSSGGGRAASAAGGGSNGGGGGGGVNPTLSVSPRRGPVHPSPEEAPHVPSRSTAQQEQQLLSPPPPPQTLPNRVAPEDEIVVLNNNAALE